MGQETPSMAWPMVVSSKLEREGPGPDLNDDTASRSEKYLYFDEKVWNHSTWITYPPRPLLPRALSATFHKRITDSSSRTSTVLIIYAPVHVHRNTGSGQRRLHRCRATHQGLGNGEQMIVVIIDGKYWLLLMFAMSYLTNANNCSHKLIKVNVNVNKIGGDFTCGKICTFCNFGMIIRTFFSKRVMPFTYQSNLNNTRDLLEWTTAGEYRTLILRQSSVKL